VPFNRDGQRGARGDQLHGMPSVIHFMLHPMQSFCVAAACFNAAKCMCNESYTRAKHILQCRVLCSFHRKNFFKFFTGQEMLAQLLILFVDKVPPSFSGFTNNENESNAGSLVLDL